MATKLELKVVPHENDLKQVIQPGDEVVIVTTGYSHRVSIKRGTYLGKKNDGCSCKVYEPRTRYRHIETGEDVGYYWTEDAKKRQILPEYPRADFRYNDPEYQAKYAAYRIQYEDYQTRCNEARDKYVPFDEPHWRHTTLQLNRIYKLDTKAWELRT